MAVVTHDDVMIPYDSWCFTCKNFRSSQKQVLYLSPTPSLRLLKVKEDKIFFEELLNCYEISILLHMRGLEDTPYLLQLKLEAFNCVICGLWSPKVCTKHIPESSYLMKRCLLENLHVWFVKAKVAYFSISCNILN